VLAIVTVAQTGLFGQMNAPVDVSYLADSVILLRYFEARGTIRKAISIVKKRSGLHDTAIRDLMLSHEGIRIGEALENFRGVLSGIPAYENVVKEIREA
jgi:circadian clock protein KaiC